MKVVALMARKGGSGKSSLVKGLASATLSSGRTALVIDTDPQGDMTMWFKKLKARGTLPRGVRFHSASSAANLNKTVMDAQDAGDTDLVFIDTAGSGTDWADQIAMVADHLVTPVMPSDGDLAICEQTVDWFKRLHGRVEQPERLPTHNVVLTRFPLMAKATKVHKRMLQEAIQRFPLLGIVVQERTAYVEMDEQGFLGDMVASYRQHSDPLQRSQARRFEEAVVECSELLTDILSRRR